MFSFLFGVLQDVHACIRSVKLQRLKSQTQRDIFFIKVKTLPRPPKMAHSNMSTSRCGKVCITPPKRIRKERGRDFYSRCSIVVAGAMTWRRCVSL